MRKLILFYFWVIAVVVWVGIDQFMINKDSLNAFASFAVIVSSIFVSWQAKVFFDDYIKRNKKDEFNKSFELSKFYINSILPKMTFVQELFLVVGILPNLKKSMNNINLKHFDAEECNGYINLEDIKGSLNKIRELPIYQLCLLVGLAEFVDPVEMNYNITKTINAEADQKQREEYRKHYQVFLAVKIENHLFNACNDLEYFSMFFNSNLAESEAVFESLHQTYLDFVKLLYPILILNNSRLNVSRKYYTHIKELYCRWRDIELKNKASLEKAIIEVGSRENKKI